MLRREIVQKWVDALRSGKYKQGRGGLRVITPEGQKHCCLGVLCEVAKLEGLPVTDRPGLDGEYLFDGADMLGVPTALREWVGYENEEAAWSVGTAWLPSLNDDRGVTFEGIAALLERTYLQ